MEITLKKIDSVNSEVSTKIDAKQIKASVDKLALQAAKTMKIDGFRKGKVPPAVVKQRAGEQLQQDAQQEIFREVLKQALSELGKAETELIGEPIVEKFDKKDNGDIDMSMVISFKPLIDLKGYESLIPEFATPRVLKKEIDEKKSELLKTVAPLEAIKEKRALAKGDFAKFDFEGFIDGKAFDGGKASDFVLEIGSGQFIPGFEDAMIGLKAGEEKDIDVTFPQSYGAKNLAGKPAVFKIKLHEIQAKKIPTKLDEEILKTLMPNEEKPTEEAFEERIKNQIRDEKMYALINNELKPKLAESLVEKYAFDVPKNIVEQEMNMQFQNAWQEFKPEEMEKYRKDKDALSKKREEFRKDAQNSVRLTFIIDELAKLRNIKVDDQEVYQMIYFEAYRRGSDPKALIDMYRQQGMLPALKMSLVEEKLFAEMFNKDEKKAKKAEKSDEKAK
ncbi:MAG: trigger factor [Campylobacter sp.]|nr:trigger factor [Campylobacter sp.]